MVGSRSLLLSALVAAALAASPAQAATSAPLSMSVATLKQCEGLAKLRIQDTTIVSSVLVPARNAQDGNVVQATTYPEFCRVVARVRSEPRSDIGVEIWLPTQGWTGVFHGNGSGGFAGTFTTGYSGMADGLRRGFATATTDTGTAPASPLDGEALIGQPRKWRDWGRLSTHVMTVTGKAITRAFYGRKVERSYYTGCSTGGQQGLIESLYYPEDYDGILVGAPVIHRTWGHAAVLWNYGAAHRKPASVLTEPKLKLLNKAAITSCWKQGHGVAGDDFVSDPLSCKFDPAVLQCTGATTDQCLSENEVNTARAFYSGPTKSNGATSYFGWLPGSEIPGLYGWSFLQTPIKDQPPFSALFKWVFGTDWNWRDFDFDRDIPKVESMLDKDVNDATRGSISQFAARGGKLIIYHGLADTLVAPGQSVAFYERQTRSLGSEANIGDAARLFLAPGMMHCGGGPGPDSFNATLGIPPRPPGNDGRYDLFSALIDWSEKGVAPQSVIATKYSENDGGKIEMQRPLCPYPKKATYRGSGTTSSANSFICQ